MDLSVDYGALIAIVDDQYHGLRAYTWRTDKNGYVYRKKRGKRIYLHHVICGRPPEGMVTDHRNRLKLDNRGLNLRHLTHAESATNKGAQRRNASGLRGANWDKSNGRWKASVRMPHGLVSLGYHDTAAQAAQVARSYRSVHMPCSHEG